MFRTLAAIVLVLLATGTAAVADVASHVRTRIVEPATTTRVADAAWQQGDLRDHIATESTNALMQQPRTLALLRRAVTVGGLAPGGAGDEVVRQRVTVIEQQVLARPESRQVFDKMITDAHANFARQVTTVPPDQIGTSQLFVIDVRPFLPLVANGLQLGSAWVAQVPPDATIIRAPDAETQGNSGAVQLLARFVQFPTWVPWLVAVVLFGMALVLVPWRAVVFGVGSVGLLASGLVAAGIGAAISHATDTSADPVERQLTHIIIDALTTDATSVRNHMLIGAAVSALFAVTLLLLARSRRTSSFQGDDR